LFEKPGTADSWKRIVTCARAGTLMASANRIEPQHVPIVIARDIVIATNAFPIERACAGLIQTFTGLSCLALGVGRAESGQRQEEAPLSGQIKVGLDSYVDPDNLSLGESATGVNAIIL
jgi:hypothetical protein